MGETAWDEDMWVMAGERLLKFQGGVGVLRGPSFSQLDLP